MLNKVFLIGYIGSPIFYTQTFKKVDTVVFKLNTKDKKNNQFCYLIAWDDIARYIREKLTYGSFIVVEGSLIDSKYYGGWNNNYAPNMLVKIEQIEAYSFRKNYSMRPIFVNIPILDSEFHAHIENHFYNKPKSDQFFDIPDRHSDKNGKI